MTLSLASHTVLEVKADDALPYSVPFGRTGSALLPDGTFVVSAYYDNDPTDLIRVWKLDTDGTVLGDIVVDTGADADGRMHLVALDGFLVQALYMTGALPGGISLVFDCSGDSPVLVDQWDDPLATSGYGSNYGSVYSLYLRASGLVVVRHANGVSVYRRGRPIVDREGVFEGGGFGLFPHPTDPYKCAFWSYTGTVGLEMEAFEIEVVSDSLVTVETLGIGVPGDDIWWVVGGGSPYASTPVIFDEDADSFLTVVEAENPLAVLWTDPTVGAGTANQFGINADTLATNCGDGTDRWAFCHELWHDYGPDHLTPTRSAFTVRAGIVDNTTGTPVVEQIDLEYDVTTPAGYPQDEFAVSLVTGSHSISHRNGEIVIATCIVQQEAATNYYAVVVWKLTGGDVARLSGLDGDWRLGINDATGRTGLKTTGGFLLEAGEQQGLDAAARPALVKTSDGWKVLGRYVEDGATAPEPELPATVDVVFVPTDFNDDLAAAAALAGPTLGAAYGAFVAQASPPAEGDLHDGSDVTFTTLAHPNLAGGDVEVLTARMTPQTSIPSGGIPLAGAIRVRGKAGAGSDGVAYLDGQVTTNGSTDAIRGKSSVYNLRLAMNLGPSITDNHYGVGGVYSAYPLSPPALLPSGYTVGASLEDAMAPSSEVGAAWWHDYLTTPGNYLVFQSAALNLAHGNFELAEFTITIRYLVP